MDNLLLAEEVVARLNDLITDADVRTDIQNLIERRVMCSDATISHLTIQVDRFAFGFLGVLNGLIGAIPEGPKQGCGYIGAVYDDMGKLVKFEVLR